MKRHHTKNVLGILCVMGIFIFAMIFLVAIIDLLIAPILREFLLDPQMRDWCGLFSRCASQTQETFVEHLTTIAFWKNINSSNIERRLKNAVILGVIIGCGYIAILFFQRRL
jgi:hypothetical protein